jgi:hypothetical protein
VTLGIVLIALGGVAAVALCAGWRYLRLTAALALMAVAAAVLGAGELLVQDGVTPAEWIVTLAVFAILAPAQAHLVLSDRSRPVAADGSAA